MLFPRRLHDTSMPGTSRMPCARAASLGLRPAEGRVVVGEGHACSAPPRPRAARRRTAPRCRRSPSSGCAGRSPRGQRSGARHAARGRQPFPASRRSAGCDEISWGCDGPDRQGRARRRVHGVRRAGDAVAAAHRVAADRQPRRGPRPGAGRARAHLRRLAPGAPRDRARLRPPDPRQRAHRPLAPPRCRARRGRRRPSGAAPPGAPPRTATSSCGSSRPCPTSSAGSSCCATTADLSEQAAADALNISVGSVKSAASRGLATLRTQLTGIEGGVR